MNTLIASLEAQLSQASASTGGATSNSSEASQIKAQLASARAALSQAAQSSDSSQLSQISTELESAQTALAQLMLSAGQTTGLVSSTA